MSPTQILKIEKDEDGKILSLKAHCDGPYVYPSAEYQKLEGNFLISAEDAAILLTHFIPGSMCSHYVYKMGQYYHGDEVYFFQKENDVADEFKRVTGKLRMELDEQTENKKELKELYEDDEKKLALVQSYYKKIPKWVRKLFFGKEIDKIFKI